MKWLIGYDIRDSKRLQRLHRRMQKYATALQYSVFLLDGNQKSLRDCLAEALQIINKKEDDLRIYPLEKSQKSWQLGKAILPEGIVWTALPEKISEN